MATFKVGQRVRIIGPTDKWDARERPLLGCEATILHSLSASINRDWSIQVDGHGVRWIESKFLAPLADSRVNEFIERLERLAREPNVAPISSPVTISTEPK